MPTAPRYNAGDTAQVLDTPYTRERKLAGKTVKVVDRLGNGLYKVRTPRGRVEHVVRIPQHLS